MGMTRPTLPDEAEMYRLMAARDPDAEGVFLVAVRTTGVFCRPTCPSRLPLPQNVEFHATPWDALVAGFRPCRRCWPVGRPNGTQPLTVTRIDTPLGTMVAAAVDDGLAVLDFADRRAARTALRNAARRLNAYPTIGRHPHLETLRAQLDEYFAGSRTTFDLPLAPRGTAFEESVWSWLRTIPSGQTRTYAEGATAVGRPQAVRAIGRANGANPLAIVVPCHRVIGSDGDLTGYGGGVWRKRALLELESATAVG
ncbi:MAG TPA: methylated-DNA--[protein]-cysteine S-methyltransferase [Candidatus Limnocylindria bacterium]|nr:methylated-DNA--[protein]-cysteine S-methyltransferase [Candidatus Limnocylindria bacterium]